ncbi:MAG: ADP-dependent glucokinase/phosphofructokinase, partial [Clostridia bacterium]
MGNKIALGMGNNVDCEIVWDTTVFETLAARYKIREAELLTDIPIRTERELLCSIFGFLKNGLGGERFVENPWIIDKFLTYFVKKTTLGGTGIRAALAMGTLGYTATIHLVTVNDQIRSLLPTTFDYVCSNDHDSHYPHLVIQFPCETVVHVADGEIRSERANRIIYNHNVDNMEMKLSLTFAEKLRDAKVLLVSGFNAMHDAECLKRRMTEMKKIMWSLPSDALVYLEDGGYFDDRLRGIVQNELCGRVNIYAMNEDEMQECLGYAVNLLDAQEVCDGLIKLHRQIPIETFVVHTRYWSVLYGKITIELKRALRGGIYLATARFRCGDNLRREDYDAINNLPEQRAGIEFSDAINRLMGEEVFCLPGLRVCE